MSKTGADSWYVSCSARKTTYITTVMGQSSSHENEKNMSQTDVVQEQGEFNDCNGVILFGQSVYPEVLGTILLHVPKTDLILNCRLVCKYWKQVIDSHSLWKMIATRNGCTIPRSLHSVQKLPERVYTNIAFWNPFGRNLIKNHCGQEGWAHWVTKASGGNGWRIEDPPTGSDSLETIEELQGYSSCFATSYQPCIKEQWIDLWKEGCSQEMLATLQPDIFICDWYCSRFDCGSVYELTVDFLNAWKECVEKIEFSHKESQWTGTNWSKVERTLKVDKLANLRYIVFQHRGKDTQFWAGYYGSKMTGSTVKLLLP